MAPLEDSRDIEGVLVRVLGFLNELLEFFQRSFKGVLEVVPWFLVRDT